MRKNIVIDNKEEKVIIKELKNRHDIKAERIKRLLNLPDLTKKLHSPIKIIADQILNLPRFADFDVMDFPKIVSVEENFDLLNTPEDHPSRRETDTYYVSDKCTLRTHTTDMWYFYLKEKEALSRLEKEGHIGLLSAGIVFRKDEIDRKHFPAFHQIDGLYVCKKEQKILRQKDLEDVLTDIAKSIFGESIEYKFLVDSFPFTDPSIEMNLKFSDDWMEILGSGLVHKQVLKNFGLDSEVYNGWAFGMGIERLAMVKMEIPDIRILWSDDPRIAGQFKDIDSKYKEVSKYPAVQRDISFVINKSVNPNTYYEMVRDIGGDLVEEVKLIDQYENEEKFGRDKKSYTFNIIYRSLERTLTNEEVNKIHEQIIDKTKQEFDAQVR